MAEAMTADEVIVDQANQRAAEHNARAFAKTLHEEGFAGVVMRPLSQFTIAIHTRTLSASERRAFAAWANGEGSMSHVRDDNDGSVWLVSI